LIGSGVASVRRKAVDSVGRHRGASGGMFGIEKSRTEPAGSQPLDHRVQVRKIAIKITMTAITATAVFVSVTNVRYMCS
jgi:hypothetical protein